MVVYSYFTVCHNSAHSMWQWLSLTVVGLLSAICCVLQYRATKTIMAARVGDFSLRCISQVVSTGKPTHCTFIGCALAKPCIGQHGRKTQCSNTSLLVAADRLNRFLSDHLQLQFDRLPVVGGLTVTMLNSYDQPVFIRWNRLFEWSFGQRHFHGTQTVVGHWRVPAFECARHDTSSTYRHPYASRTSENALLQSRSSWNWLIEVHPPALVCLIVRIRILTRAVLAKRKSNNKNDHWFDWPRLWPHRQVQKYFDYRLHENRAVGCKTAHGVWRRLPYNPVVVTRAQLNYENGVPLVRRAVTTPDPYMLHKWHSSMSQSVVFHPKSFLFYTVLRLITFHPTFTTSFSLFLSWVHGDVK